MKKWRLFVTTAAILFGFSAQVRTACA